MPLRALMLAYLDPVALKTWKCLISSLACPFIYSPMSAPSPRTPDTECIIIGNDGWSGIDLFFSLFKLKAPRCMIRSGADVCLLDFARCFGASQGAFVAHYLKLNRPLSRVLCRSIRQPPFRNPYHCLFKCFCFVACTNWFVLRGLKTIRRVRWLVNVYIIF